MGWYEERFQPHPQRVQCSCANCSRAFWLPPCEVKRRRTCGKPCAKALAEAAKAARRRACSHCGVEFTPRTTQLAAGQGLFCSISCSTRANGQLWTAESRRAAVSSLLAAIEEGRYLPPKGETHHQWAGGPQATTRRRALSGKAAAWTRKYRAANPDWARECAHRRQKRKLGRLPRGTVNRIGTAQRWRCAVCRCDIRHRYHQDHIRPLARGGKHEPSNIQLLCPTCNVRKAAKDPIDFMQSSGFLL